MYRSIRTGKDKNSLKKPKGEKEAYSTKVKKGDILLLCSDGFRHEISEKEMLSLLGRCESNKLNEMIKRLISLNLRRNEQDNISAALVKVQ